MVRYIDRLGAGSDGERAVRAGGHAWWPARPPRRGAATGPPMVLDTGAFTPFVENMDRSLAFYHDVFGMEVPPMPASGVARPTTTRTRGCSRSSTSRAPRSGTSRRGSRASAHRVEAMEIQQRRITRRCPLRVQDPGNATLVLVVRDVDATLAKVKQGEATRWSLAGGAPGEARRRHAGRCSSATSTTGSSRSASRPAMPGERACRQHRGHPRRRSPWRTWTGPSRCIGDVLELHGRGRRRRSRGDKAARALTGLPKAEARRARAKARNSTMWFEFVEFKGVERTPLKMRIRIAAPPGCSSAPRASTRWWRRSRKLA